MGVFGKLKNINLEENKFSERTIMNHRSIQKNNVAESVLSKYSRLLYITPGVDELIKFHGAIMKFS